MRSRNTSAFTLVEAMVVAAIISTLLAISLPSLMRVIDGARETRCMAQLRGVNLAMATYTADHRGMLPQLGAPRLTRSFENAGFWHNYFDQTNFWTVGLIGYLDPTPGANTMTCIGSELHAENPSDDVNQLPKGAVLSSAYKYNTALFTGWRLWNPSHPIVDVSQLHAVNIANVDHPSRKIAFSEKWLKHLLDSPKGPPGQRGRYFFPDGRPRYNVPIALCDGATLLVTPAMTLEFSPGNPFLSPSPFDPPGSMMMITTLMGHRGRDF
jgi:type II secretory pathway pseudopilin PulG